MKRSFDIIISLVLLVLLSPIFFTVALLIKLQLGSPIIFQQIRPGFNEKLFTLYKFRTMNNEKNNLDELLPDHQRLHSFGAFLRRYSLDEMPQLINVLKGDLSLVGPRPLLIEYLPLYTEEQARRHLVKPGITGWAQINGRNAITWEEKFKLDNWYVDNQTFLLDIKIVWITLIKVLKSEGVNYSEHVSMERFTGTHVLEREEAQ